MGDLKHNVESNTNVHINLFGCIVSRVCSKIEIMIMIMISYKVLQKRLISQKYKNMFSWKIRLVAISIR